MNGWSILPLIPTQQLWHWGHEHVCFCLTTHLSSLRCWSWGYGTWSQGLFHSCAVRSERYTHLSTCSIEACGKQGEMDLQTNGLGEREREKEIKSHMRITFDERTGKIRTHVWYLEKTKLSLRIHIFHKFQQMYVVNDTSLKPTAL